MNSQMVQPEGNYYDKYHSSNPIVKWMMRGFFKSMTLLLKKHQVIPKRILEAGCGEGEVTNFYVGNIYTMMLHLPGSDELQEIGGISIGDMFRGNGAFEASGYGIKYVKSESIWIYTLERTE